MERWGFARNYANKQIAAAEVARELGTDVPTPANEAQARELARLQDKPTSMLRAWQEAIETAQEEERSVTAADVRAAVEARLPKPSPPEPRAEQAESAPRSQPAERQTPDAEAGRADGNGGPPPTSVQSPAEQLAAFSAECRRLAEVAAALEVEEVEEAAQDAEQPEVDGWRDDFCKLREELDRLTELTYAPASSDGRVR